MVLQYKTLEESEVGVVSVRKEYETIYDVNEQFFSRSRRGNDSLGVKNFITCQCTKSSSTGRLGVPHLELTGFD